MNGYDFPLPRGAIIEANSGERISVGRLSGTAQIRGMVIVLDSMQMTTHAGKPALRFIPSDARFPSLVTAALPRENKFDLEKVGDIEFLIINLKKHIPEAVFTNIFQSVDDPVATAKLSCRTQVLNIASPGGHWHLETFPQSTLRTYPSNLKLDGDASNIALTANLTLKQ